MEPFKGNDLRKVLFVEKVRAARGDIKKLGESPYLVEIIPTPRCNSRCSFCSYRKRNAHHRTPLRELSLPKIENVFQHISPSTKGIFISGGGEPTCYEHIEELLQLCVELCDTGLCSNYADIDKVSDASLAALAFYEWSVVAGDRVTYTTVTTRMQKMFDRVGVNIRRVVSLRDMLPQNHIQYLIAKVLICRDNYKTISRILGYLDALGVDSIALRLVNNYEDIDVELRSGQLEDLKAISSREQITSLEHKLCHHTDPEKTNRLLLASECYTVTQGHFAIIDCDGEVYVCVPSSTDRQWSIGNINVQPWHEIWGSERHKDVVEALNCTYTKGNCKLSGCRHFNFNCALERGRKGKDQDVCLKDFQEMLGAFI